MTTRDEAPVAGAEELILVIEEVEYPWHEEEILVAEIRRIGKIPADQVIIVELEDGTERKLGDHEKVPVKRHHRHGRAPKYRRG